MNRYTKTSALFLVVAFFTAALANPVYAAAKWTFMVYLDGDNNLEGAGLTDFLEMAEVGSNANINIVVQMDRIDSYDDLYGDWTSCKRFRVTQNMEPTSGNALQDLGEVNMGDPETLKSFINWATGNYPAERYALILWDHGGGWAKKKRSGEEKFPIFKDVCWDDTNNSDFLSMKEIKEVLNAVSVKPDMVGFDACLMGMIENAYLLKDSGAEVMVGSEETEPGDGWPYNTILQGLNSNLGWAPSQLGSWIVDKYYESYGNDQTQSAIDLSKLNALGTAVSDFATAIRSSWNADKNAVTNAAQLVISRIEHAVINSKVGEIWRGAQGLSVYFPSDSYSFSSVYNQTDFAANTYWEEFLTEYYNSMTGSWIEAARNQAVYFDVPEYIDLHHFCSLLAESADTSPGYSVQQAAYNFEDISTTGARLNVGDENYARISPSGFTFSYYDNTYAAFSISDNGVVFFEDTAYPAAYENESVPGSTQWGNKFIAACWDDFDGGVIYWQVKGIGTDKRLIVQWDEATPYAGISKGPVLNSGTFQTALYENGRVLCQYKDTDFGDTLWNEGNSATVGVQGAKSRGLQYSHNSEKITSQSAVLFIPATEGSCSYLLSATEKFFDSAGGDATVSVTTESGCNWTASSNDTWISIIEGKTGNGNGTVRYTAAPNTALSPRTGSMTIAEQTFTVNQSAPCGFEISPSEKTFSGDSDGTGMIEVSASESGCTWEASSQVTWISISSGSSGSGNGTVRYSVFKNPGDRRIGNIVVAGKIFTLTQETASNPEAALLSNGVAVKGLSQELGGGLYYKIQVPSGAVNLQIFTQGGTGDCDILARRGDKPATDIYDAESSGYGNDELIAISYPPAGDWYILLYAYQTFGGVSLTAAYNTAESCGYTLSPSSLNFLASGGIGSFNVNTGSDCFWTASASVSWIEILGSFFNMGNGKVDFRISQNTDSVGRIGTVTVMDQTVIVTQEGSGSVQITTLANDVSHTGLFGLATGASYYKIDVPSGQNELKIELWGGEGDCDLYARYGQPPNLEVYDGISDHYGNDEFINFENPQSGEWYIMLYGYSDYSGVSLKAAYREALCNYTLSQAEISAGQYGGYGDITVIAEPGCSWNAFSYYDWIVIISGDYGTGTETVTYSISPNEDLDERSGLLEIAGQLVFITQEGTSSVISLFKGVEVSGLSGWEGDNLFFKIDVPSGQKNLIIDSWGGTGDFDMYVRYGALPVDTYDFQCFAWGNDENVYIRNPDAGEWYILLRAWEYSSDVSVKAEYNTLDCNYTVSPMSRSFDASGGYETLSVDTGPGCSWTAIKHGTWIEIVSERRGAGNGSVTYSVTPNDSPDIRTNNIRIADQWVTVIQSGTVRTIPEKLTDGAIYAVSGSADTSTYYEIDVPTGQERLIIEISGGTGDCDLYVRYADFPTFRKYDFMPYLSGNDETVTVENPQSGTWYMMLNAYNSDYSNVSLKAETVDEGIGIADAIVILQILTGFTPDLLTLPDFDYDGKVGIADAVYILQVTAGLRNKIKIKALIPVQSAKSCFSAENK